jgi:2-oxoglutarate dehydrogenase complex dehydrogenase (E1) component-like enzyme
MSSTFPTAAAAVQAFWEQKMSSGEQQFTAAQLRFFVQNNYTGKSSPSSSDRILRMLRQNNKLNYVVLNRINSLYEARDVATAVSDATGFGG